MEPPAGKITAPISDEFNSTIAHLNSVCGSITNLSSFIDQIIGKGEYPSPTAPVIQDKPEHLALGANQVKLLAAYTAECIAVQLKRLEGRL